MRFQKQVLMYPIMSTSCGTSWRTKPAITPFEVKKVPGAVLGLGFLHKGVCRY